MTIDIGKYAVAVDKAATQSQYLHDSLKTRELDPRYPAMRAKQLKKRGPAYLPAYEAYSFFVSAFEHRRKEVKSHIDKANELMPMIVGCLNTINDPEYETLDTDSVMRMTKDLNDMVESGANMVRQADRLLEEIRGFDHETRTIAQADQETIDRRHRKLAHHRKRVPQIIITDPESEQTDYPIWPAAPEQPAMKTDPICSLVREKAHNSLCPCHRKRADRKFENVSRFKAHKTARSDIIDRRKSI